MAKLLLEQVARGDHEVFARFYDETAGFVFGMALHACRYSSSAESLATEVYLTAWRIAPTFDPEHSTPDEWLTGITAASICTSRQD